MQKQTQSFDKICSILNDYVSPILSRGILRGALNSARISNEELETARSNEQVFSFLQNGIRLYINDNEKRQLCLDRISTMLKSEQGKTNDWVKQEKPQSVTITTENDVVEARNRARSTARVMGFNNTDQVKIATAVSELSRNIFNYARTGVVVIQSEYGSRRALKIDAKDKGPGIRNIQEILSGNYRSKTGLGLGIIGCKQLMDEFDIQTEVGQGTQISIKKYL